MITMIQAMRHGMLPATRHVDAPTPHVDWSAGTVRLLTEAVPWPALPTGRARRVAVSSFGISGTNAHLVLEQAPAVPAPTPLAAPAIPAAMTTGSPPTVQTAPAVWPLSGRTPEGLAAVAASLAAHLGADGPDASSTEDIMGVAAALAARTALPHRAAVVGRDRHALIAGLTSLAAGEPTHNVVTGSATTGPGPVFVFPGQGGQWTGMAVELLDSSPIFATRMTECEHALNPHVQWSLQHVLRNGNLETVDIIQPALWAIMISLATLWESIGVHPAAVIGHSQGEIAAAVVAGALTLTDGAQLIALRSQALTTLSGTGAMLAIATTPDDITHQLTHHPGTSIAAINSPTSVVVSGDPHTLTTLANHYNTNAIRTRLLPVDYAAHSNHIDPLQHQLTTNLHLTPTPGRPGLRYQSTVTATPTDPTTLDTNYWWHNLRQPVKFDPAIRDLLNTGYHQFIEISPHPILTTAITTIAEHHGTHTTPTATLHHNHGNWQQFLTSAAHAWTHGQPINWTTGGPRPPPPPPPTTGRAGQRR
jgi:acyl transferase domain-containing protein